MEKTSIKIATGETGQLIIEGSGVFFDDGFKEWIEKHHDEEIHLRVNCFVHLEGLSALYIEFIDLDLSAVNKKEVGEDGIFAEVDDSFQVQFTIGELRQWTILCCQDSFLLVRDPLKWLDRHREGACPFVVHSARINSDSVCIVLLDPEKSAEVWRITRKQNEKAKDTELVK